MLWLTRTLLEIRHHLISILRIFIFILILIMFIIIILITVITLRVHVHSRRCREVVVVSLINLFILLITRLRRLATDINILTVQPATWHRRSQHCQLYRHSQGWIMHEAGEAEASGPGPQTARYNENLQSRTTSGPKITRENLRSSKIFAKRHLNPSSRSATIHPTTNQPTKNK